jgi:hypothetical protein
MQPALHRRINQNTQESLAPDGSPVRQQVMAYEYCAITRGPLVYATGLIDGFKTEETVRLPAPGGEPMLELLDREGEYLGRTIRLNLGYRPAIDFQPYFEAGGRRDDTWRLTWLRLAPV